MDCLGLVVLWEVHMCAELLTSYRHCLDTVPQYITHHTYINGSLLSGVVWLHMDENLVKLRGRMSVVGYHEAYEFHAITVLRQTEEFEAFVHCQFVYPAAQFMTCVYPCNFLFSTYACMLEEGICLQTWHTFALGADKTCVHHASGH